MFTVPKVCDIITVERSVRMKKYVVALLGIVLLVITGCGNSKTLSCSIEENEQISVVDMKFSEEGILKTIELKRTKMFEEELTKQGREYMDSYMKVYCSGYDMEGVSCTSETGTSSSKLMISVDLDRMLDEDKSDIISETDDLTYDSIKSKITDNGYVCK